MDNVLLDNPSTCKWQQTLPSITMKKWTEQAILMGSKGDAIPLSARIVMLADIYDALRSERSYKPEFSHEKTADIIINGDGRVEPIHFDPEVWRVFKNYHEEFNRIFSRLNG